MSGTRSSIGRGEDQRLQHYLQHIERYEILSMEEEFELARRIRDGDREALDRLVNANLHHVVGIARGFLNHGLDDMDLIAEGNVGLISAAHNFDCSREIRFISFAKLWIGRAIRKAVVVHLRVPRLPSTLVIGSSPWLQNTSSWAD